MTASPVVLAHPAEAEAWWSEGTRSDILVPATSTGARLSVLREILPGHSGPPLHRHPEEETYVVLSGVIDVWMHPGPDNGASWWTDPRARGYRCGPNRAVTVPGGIGHCYRVRTDQPAEVIVVSRPSGLEAWTRAMGVPATAPGLPPAGSTPPAPRAEILALAHRLRVERLGDPVAPIDTPLEGETRPVPAIDQRGARLEGSVWLVASGGVEVWDRAGWLAAPEGTVIVADAPVSVRSRSGARVLVLSD
ncbi:hypothetical protein GCM10009808_01410 [Microbacterium sediminicola]|uniref:Cupin type-2 domain-containing protein n=1 Tax=Microbacterium sediminicola TaxID=415210 RepID=A0ABN2HI83_9MICO